jgi:hypothetical protein
MSIINGTYVVHGVPVVVLAKWRHLPTLQGVKGPPGNVLIQYSDGTKVVRHLRDLEKHLHHER